MSNWSFQTLRKTEDTGLVPGGKEEPDAGGARRLGALRLSNNLKYVSICIAVAGLLLSIVGIVVGVVVANQSSETTVTVTGNGTVVITTASAGFTFPPSAPPPMEGLLCIKGYWPLTWTENVSNTLSPINSSHTHVLGGVTYYMPNGWTGAVHNGSCPDTALFLQPAPPPPQPPSNPSPTPPNPSPEPSPPPPSPAPPAASVSCMPASVPVANTGSSYTISGSTADLYVGANQYTFTGVPSGHPMRLVAHGTYSSPCAPQLVSYSSSVLVGGYYGTYYYYGTVVYNLGSCPSPSAVEFVCGYHGSMSSGKPWLTVNSGC